MSSPNNGSTSLCEPQRKSFIDELPNELLVEIFSRGTRGTCAINSPCLWTSLTVDTSITPHPIAESPPSHLSTIFPREFLILERSSNMDVDITFSKNGLGSPKHTLKHLELLSTLFATHAHHIRTLDLHVEDAKSPSKLCSRLHRVVLPRLQKFRLNWDYPFADPDDEHSLFPLTHMLDYPYVARHLLTYNSGALRNSPC
ncbi:hypothetical protein IW262DRAFT_1553750 [Armillaria fumosa]|nr:hypothetical protein IW262DRAFT_1553750 [Armillaria fumosa]